VAAVSAALAYDFFLTTPYHTLVIDSLAQVITVTLLGRVSKAKVSREMLRSWDEAT
jgi:hypothetical protein